FARFVVARRGMPAGCSTLRGPNHLTLQVFPCITNACVRFRGSMFPITKKALRMDRNPLRTLLAISALKSAVFMAVFTSCSLAIAADTPAGKPQIQGAILPVEFDNRL